jgi:hypothetical protein
MAEFLPQEHTRALAFYAALIEGDSVITFRGLPGPPTLTSSSNSQSEHDEHDQGYEPHCMRTRTIVKDGARPSMVRFAAQDESTWEYRTGQTSLWAC